MRPRRWQRNSSGITEVLESISTRSMAGYKACQRGWGVVAEVRKLSGPIVGISASIIRRREFAKLDSCQMGSGGDEGWDPHERSQFERTI
jgi:hypothetical protein